MQNLKKIFKAVLTSRIKALQLALDELGESGEAQESIRRIAHSLKGSAKMYGYPEIGEFAHTVEETSLEDLPEKTRQLLTRLEALQQSKDAKATIAHILVIDDDPLITHLIKSVLENAGHQVIVAASAAQARLEMQQQKYQLIILDLLLPDADGRNFLVELKETSAYCSIPVFILSAKTSTATKSECLALGAEVYLEKPFDPDELVNLVEKKLHQQKEISRERDTDPVTRLLNRAAFHEKYHEYQIAYEETDQTFVITLINIDQLDKINQQYSPAMGTQVIRYLGQKLAAYYQEKELLARWEGGEFIGLFFGSEESQVAEKLQYLQEQFSQYKFTTPENESFQSSFSAAVAEFNWQTDHEDAYVELKKRLVTAKKRRRGQIITSQEYTQPLPLRIFIAEDDELISSIVKHRLIREGYEVTHAEDGKSAWELLQQDSAFTVIILDVKMPEMNGFEVLKNLRKHPDLEDIPVIILTSMGKEQDIVHGLELGANDYILKPFSPVELLARIQRFLKK